MNRYQIKKYMSKMLFLALMAVLTVIFLLPFVVMFTTSFKTMEDAFMVPVRIWPREFTVRNYVMAINKIPYFSYMANTTYITLMSLLGEMLVVPMVAYSLSKIKWKGAGILSGLLMGTMMLPFTLTMIPLYRTWYALGLTGT